MSWVIALLILAIILLLIVIGLIWNVGEAINASYIWQRQLLDELQSELKSLKERFSSPRT